MNERRDRIVRHGAGSESSQDKIRQNAKHVYNPSQPQEQITSIAYEVDLAEKRRRVSIHTEDATNSEPRPAQS